MCQVFSSLQGHLQFFVCFFFTFMEHFFLTTLYFKIVHQLIRKSYQYTVVQNNQESRHKHWATCLSVCSPLTHLLAPHCSLWLRTLLCLFNRSLTSLTPKLVKNIKFDVSESGCSEPWCNNVFNFFLLLFSFLQ